MVSKCDTSSGIDPGLTCVNLQQVAVEDPIHKPATKLTYSQLNEQITQVSFIFNMVPTIWDFKATVE